MKGTLKAPIKAETDELKKYINRRTLGGYHSNGILLTIPDVRQGTFVCIRGSGNNNYFIGIVYMNETDGSVYPIISNKEYDDNITVSNGVITMPTSGWYVWHVSMS